MNAVAAPEIAQEDFNFKDTPTNDRIGFVRKVLGIVSAQLVITSLITALVLSSASLTETLQNSLATLILLAITAIIISIALICSKKLSRTVPYNYALLLAFVSPM